MNSVSNLNAKNIKYLFTDIDDTITHDGQLPAHSYDMLWQLSKVGVHVIPITGRPAGWCDMIARMWPVKAVIGENGAFYFSYENKKMKRYWVLNDEERAKNKIKLESIKTEVLSTVPGAAVSADQFCREFDLAIDFCEDVSPLSPKAIQDIVAVFVRHGAQAKVSSIHVNGWFGNYDKLSMCKIYCEQELKIDLSKNQNLMAFSGDSPNDEPLFGYFENSVGVANVNHFASTLTHLPKFICTQNSADGFVELGQHILKAHQN